ncbi:hypothetical protein B0J18DRAFT_439963 [Chaetomium sp. MPI-SDFR-AT-0129]|nr:hypothetical protein B0J18DRAFT_439963 [Chaetomium sp. MPI-SDFR-AT-0129]
MVKDIKSDAPSCLGLKLTLISITRSSLSPICITVSKPQTTSAKMKTTTFFTAVAVLIVSAVALPNPNPAPEASPQICSCVLGCYDTCGAKLCC